MTSRVEAKATRADVADGPPWVCIYLLIITRGHCKEGSKENEERKRDEGIEDRQLKGNRGSSKQNKIMEEKNYRKRI